MLAIVRRFYDLDAGDGGEKKQAAPVAENIDVKLDAESVMELIKEKLPW